MEIKKMSVGQTKVLAHESPLEKIKKAMDAISYLPNGVASWVEAHSGDKQLASDNAKKIQQAEAILADVLSSMPNAFTYNVYGLKEELSFGSATELIKKLASMGIKHTGQSSKGGQTRKELHDQPKFDKLIGPMYDGAGKIRYETQETYDVLSR